MSASSAPPPFAEARRRSESTRRRLYELEAAERWAHHAVDLDREAVLTTTQDRPISTLTRAAQLAKLGHDIDTGVFSGPAYHLTPRLPYRASPEAWIEADNPAMYNSGYDLLYWDVPADWAGRTPFYGMIFHFALAPFGRALASLTVSSQTYPGRTGLLFFSATWTGIEVYVPLGTSPEAHTVDFAFAPPAAPQPTEIVMGLIPGTELLKFTAISFARARLVAEPVAPA